MELAENIPPRKRQGWLINTVIVLTVLVFVLTVGITVGKIQNPEDTTIFGMKLITIESNSMEPMIQTDALVIGVKKDFQTLELGDIITYEMPNGRLNTHRIISKEEGLDLVYTKGDNAASQDLLDITPDNYKYKIIYIWNWVSELKTVKGFFVYIVLPVFALILVIIFLTSVVGLLRRIVTQKGTRQQAQEQLQAVNAYISECEAPAVPAPASKQVVPGSGAGREPPAQTQSDWRDALFDGIDLTDIDFTGIDVSEIKAALPEFDLDTWMLDDLSTDVEPAAPKASPAKAEHLKAWKQKQVDIREMGAYLTNTAKDKSGQQVSAAPQEDTQFFTGWREETACDMADQTDMPVLLSQELLHRQALTQAFAESTKQETAGKDWREMLLQDIDFSDIALDDLHTEDVDLKDLEL